MTDQPREPKGSPKGGQWTKDPNAFVPSVLYRNTPTSDPRLEHFTGGELGGGVYFNFDKNVSLNYHEPTDRSVHEFEWVEVPTLEEMGYAHGEGGSPGDIVNPAARGEGRLIRGTGEILWSEDPLKDYKQNRADMHSAAKAAKLKVVVGLTTHEGSGQVAVLNPSDLKHKATIRLTKANMKTRFTTESWPPPDTGWTPPRRVS